MDISLLSQLLKELVTYNDRISLPGMGSFMVEVSSAYFTDKGKTINPPYRKLYFKVSEIWNDELLETIYSERTGLLINDAKIIIQEFLTSLKSRLNEDGRLILPGLGVFRATEEGKLFFMADEDLDIYPESFGLEPISLKNLMEIEMPDNPDEVQEETEVILEAVEEMKDIEGYVEGEVMTKVGDMEVQADVQEKSEIQKLQEYPVQQEPQPQEPQGSQEPQDSQTQTDEFQTHENGQSDKMQQYLDKMKEETERDKEIEQKIKKKKKTRRLIIILICTAIVIFALVILVLRAINTGMIDNLLYNDEEKVLMEQLNN